MQYNGSYNPIVPQKHKVLINTAIKLYYLKLKRDEFYFMSFGSKIKFLNVINDHFCVIIFFPNY